MAESILDRYKRQLEADKLNEDTMFPSETTLKDEDKKAYVDELKRQRNSEYSMEAEYKRKMNEFVKLNESEMTIQGNIKFNNVVETKIIRAYCPECGEEIKSTLPTMFNPYTGEKQNIYRCKCGKKYNLEFAYPRFAFFDDEGNEVVAFGR